MSFVPALALALFGAQAPSAAPAPEPDRDRDGLSDFHETHKYGTDPARADSDGDGVPDGDWEERREYAYTVRSIVQVLPPVTKDVLCDDYQDARILEERAEYVELEVLHYPLNTVASAIVADPRWRETTRKMTPWTKPGPTANWDEPMRKALVAALAKADIRVEELDDKTLVERASKWLLEHAKSVDGFSTFCSSFENGRARIHPGLEAAAERGKADKGLTVEEQWQRELFAKGMFEHGLRGTCTSSAIYLNGCLRALGIPTRIVLCIPVVDASDERELEFVRRRLEHDGVRRIVSAALEPLASSWSSHTYNEVFVGGRWRRLNYSKLGQNILDRQCFGLMTHVATFSDWADGEMAKTWGWRQKGEVGEDDPFGGRNPYSAIALSDRFGAHAKVPRDFPPEPGEVTTLTITKAYWWHSPERKVEMDLDAEDGAGHALVHVAEGRAGEGASQYERFYARVNKQFRLRAPGKPEVPISATRGYWAKPEEDMQEFYLRIEADDFERMAPGVPYALIAPQESDGHGDYRWVVADGVTLTRPASGVPPPLTRVKTLDGFTWSDDASIDASLRSQFKPAVLLAHVAEWSGFEDLKRFTQQADQRFFLEAAGRPTLKVGCDVGGVSKEDGSVRWIVIQLGAGDWRDLVAGVEYTLRPQNSKKGWRWEVAPGMKIARKVK